jgi:tetratricopeptide (TPR) repeat protein
MCFDTARMPMLTVAFASILVLAVGQAPNDPEAKLAEARARYEAAPNDPEAVIWLGRRTAYLGRYEEAVEIYSRGIAAHPRYAKLYRHRGHRYITLRRFDLAIADLERAASLVKGVPDEVEPDGLPNARNTPTSTSHTNIWYHLGLAYYVTGDFERALRSYRECLKFSKNPDMVVATTYWHYLTLRRLGRDRDARKALEPIREGMDVIENGDYHRLLLAYKARSGVDQLLDAAAKGGSELSLPTIGYGVGAWHFVEGRKDAAAAAFRRVVASPQRAAFGYIAAEAELARLDRGRRAQ